MTDNLMNEILHENKLIKKEIKILKNEITDLTKKIEELKFLIRNKLLNDIHYFIKFTYL